MSYEEKKSRGLIHKLSGMPLMGYDHHLYPFESKWMEIEDQHIHFIDEGSGDVLLFCHPPVSSSFMYRNMIPVLSRQFRCIAPDFPGFGLSVASKGYTPSIMREAAIIEKLLIKLEVTSVFLIMQEVGGHAGITVFIKHPGWLRGIILTDTIIFPVSQYPKIKTMLKLVNSKVFNFFNSNFNLIIRIVTSSGVKKRKMTKEEKDTYKAMFSSGIIRRISTSMLYQLVKQEILLEQIQRTFETRFNSLPVLLIYGELDPLTKLGIPQRILSMMKNAELHFISGEKHFPHEGAPEEMSQQIISWLNKIRKG
ncbi:MAG: alpha/beta fold hydrolase [Flavisolibacter sp.]